MKTLILLAWRNLWRNKRRSLIALASVCFAVFFSVLMSAVQNGMYDRMIEQIIGRYSGFVQVHAAGYWEDQTLDYLLPREEALEEVLLQHPEVTGIRPRLQSFALAADSANSRGVGVMGIDYSLERETLELDSLLVSGNLDSLRPGDLILGKRLAGHFNLEVGDSLVLLGGGYRGQSANGLFRIGAVVRFRAVEMDQQMILMDLPSCQYFLGAQDLVSAYLIDFENYRHSSPIAAALHSSLGREDLEIMPWTELFPEMEQAIQADASGGKIMMFILYLVIGFGLLGTVLMMTAERQREMGVLVAVGMKRGRLALMTLVESCLLGVIGALAGILLVRPLQWRLHEHPIPLSDNMAQTMEESGFEAVIPASLNWGISLEHALIIFVLTLLIGLYPVFRILRLQPVNAMRS